MSRIPNRAVRSRRSSSLWTFGDYARSFYDIARKVAVVGYYVLLPDLYYRQGRIRHQWRNERGQMISMHNLDPERAGACALGMASRTVSISQ